jgi:hypothetical protein
MKRVVGIFAVIAVCTCVLLPAGQAGAMFSFGLPRDDACLDQFYPAPCVFPPVCSACAVPCRIPGIQCQAVPCAIVTACPSKRLPCHGVSYGANPYPIFR